MQVIDTVETWRKALDSERHAGRTVGLVPTMGFLHDGHASLIRRAAADCDAVGVTLFVNPLQFGPHEDLASYPRDLDADRQLVTESGARYLFVPSVEEMYPSPVTRSRSPSSPISAAGRSPSTTTAAPRITPPPASRPTTPSPCSPRSTGSRQRPGFPWPRTSIW